jgi:transient receptor potential cation channel subfamily M protein 3
LKLFLSKFDIERLYDFEEECVEGMLKENALESQRKTEVRVKSVQVGRLGKYSSLFLFE